jgi:hypothetical protein
MPGISLHIAGELFRPEVSVGFGRRRDGAAGMTMPEATMDEDDSAMPGKHDVWLPG